VLDPLLPRSFIEADGPREQFLQHTRKEGSSDENNVSMGVADISLIPAFGPKEKYVNAVIEAPRGSHIKFKYDEEQGLFVFEKLLPIGQSFPFDFGFVPSTLAEDGDPLDVLVLTEEPSFAGCLIHAQLRGVIEAEQTVNGETERNDRLIAVPLNTKSGEPVASLPEKVTMDFAREIAKFFIAYNELQEKDFKVLGCAGPKRAKTLVRRGIDDFNKHAGHRKIA
jgi:inorganic pyrophosphatase